MASYKTPTRQQARDSESLAIAALDMLAALEAVVWAETYDHRPLGNCGPTKTAAFEQVKAAIALARHE